MASVTFPDGTPIISDAQGVWKFEPGMMQPSMSFVAPPRTIGEIAKEHNILGCDHVLNLTFLNVAVASIGSTFETLLDLYMPDDGEAPSGTLVVPDYGSYPHCVVSGCEPVGQNVTAMGINPDDLIGSKRYDLKFKMTFRQLRR